MHRGTQGVAQNHARLPICPIAHSGMFTSQPSSLYGESDVRTARGSLNFSHATRRLFALRFSLAFTSIGTTPSPV